MNTPLKSLNSQPKDTETHPTFKDSINDTPDGYKTGFELSDFVDKTAAPTDWNAIAAKHLIPQGINIPVPEVIFEVQGIPMLTKKSMSLLIAKAKAGKTTVAAWIIAQVILLGIKVLWIDTEQGLYYASRTQYWILSTAGLQMSDRLFFYDLKIYPPNDRIKIIEALIQSGHYELIVIDGIRDLVFDINDPKEATNTATSLMKWAEVYNSHLLTILHQNKGNEHARGHLGAELTNKAEMVLKVSQGESNEIIIEPEFTRGEPFQTFALIRGEAGKPRLLENWKAPAKSEKSRSQKVLLPTEIIKETHIEILQKVFNAQAKKKYNELLSSLKNQINSWYGYSISDAKVKTYIQYYIDEGIITKSGQTPQTRYYLNPESVLV